MVERFATTLCRFDEDAQALLDMLLATIVVKKLGAQTALHIEVV